jgi:outer membrane receptor protein involved in Fe transport
MAVAGGAAAQSAASQEPTAPTEQERSVHEVGGRLIAAGETVVVKGDRDEAPRESSVATKTETRLLDTPRSISVIDRQTLDDLSAIGEAESDGLELEAVGTIAPGLSVRAGYAWTTTRITRDALGFSRCCST